MELSPGSVAGTAKQCDPDWEASLNLSSHSGGAPGWKSQVKVSQDWVLLRNVKEALFHGSLQLLPVC